MTDSRYVEYVEGTYTNRGMALKLGELPEQDEAPSWRSYFSFDNNVIKFLKKEKALKNSYPYQIYLEEIVLDYDGVNLKDVHDALKGTLRYMVDYLEIPEMWIRVFFSGNKGFHIHIPDVFGIKPGPLLPVTLKKTVTELFGFNPYLDTVMIRPGGLIRNPYSPHDKTKYFKSPIDISEVYRESTDNILMLSAQPRKLDFFHDISDVSPILRDSIVSPSTEIALQIDARQREAYDPSVYMTCMQTLLARGPEQGRRHTDLLRLASWIWKSGMTPDVAYSALQSWVGDPHMGEDLHKVITAIWEGRYSYGCFDEVMHEFCDPKCAFFKKKQVIVESMKNIRSGSESLVAMREYKQKLSENRGIDLHNFYSFIKDYKIVPGEVMLVIGDTGVGKSAMVQNWVIDSRLKTLYLNLEMPEHLTFRRFLQIRHGITADQAWKKIDEPAFAEQVSTMKVETVSEAPKIDDLERLFEYRKDIDMLVVDTTDGIDVPKAGNNEFFKLDVIINTLRRIAQTRNIIIIAIHHINKSAARDQQIDLQAPTGNRAAVTKVDHVMALIGDQTDSNRVLKSLKSRDTEPIRADLEFDWEYMIFRQRVFKKRKPMNESPRTNSESEDQRS